jgi:hypothetical protein
MAETIINIAGNQVPLSDLKQDVIEAKKKGYNSNNYAFTVDTVEGLIEKIDELIGILVNELGS